MYWTYLRRELSGRKKQTIIVAAGLAIAIALVIIVNALSAGVRDAQARALESVYGVGNDLHVTGAMAEPGEGGGARFEFGQDGVRPPTTARRPSASRGSRPTSCEARWSPRPSTRRRSTVWQRHPVPSASPTRPSRASCPSRRAAISQARSPRGRPRLRRTARPELRRRIVRRRGVHRAGHRPRRSSVGPLASVEVSDGRALDGDMPARASQSSTRPTPRPPTSPSGARSASAAPT